MKHHRPTVPRRDVLKGIVAATALVGVGGCTRLLNEAAALGTNVRVENDISFGPDNRHQLDMYLPENVTRDTPLIVFWYGGSWKWGSRSRYEFVGYSLASKGFAVAVADYRLFPEVRFPDFNYDAARAVVWLQNNRKRFGLGQGAAHLMGHSAGAHIAVLVALDPKYLAKWGSSPKEIASVIGLAGPYGMHPSKVSFIADVFPTTDHEDEARPVTFAHSDGPPMLLLHGAGDGLVAPKNSVQMADLQTAAGSKAQARVYETIGHKEIIVALAPPFQGLAPVLDDISSFVESIDAQM